MKSKIPSGILFILALMFCMGLKAQNLVVTLTNSTVETFPVSNIQSIKFGSSSMTLYELNGTITTWETSNIDNYAFDGSASISDELNIVNSSLALFPNPATSLVNIQYSTSSNSTISIDIIDVNGRIVESIFQGPHQGEQTYQWNSKVSSGVYYCRIVTQNKVITRSLNIQ